MPKHLPHLFFSPSEYELKCNSFLCKFQALFMPSEIHWNRMYQVFVMECVLFGSEWSVIFKNVYLFLIYGAACVALLWRLSKERDKHVKKETWEGEEKGKELLKSSAKRIREVDKTSASENETRDGRRENIREEERVKSQRVSFHKAGSSVLFSQWGGREGQEITLTRLCGREKEDCLSDIAITQIPNCYHVRQGEAN